MITTAVKSEPRVLTTSRTVRRWWRDRTFRFTLTTSETTSGYLKFGRYYRSNKPRKHLYRNCKPFQKLTESHSVTHVRWVCPSLLTACAQRVIYLKRSFENNWTLQLAITHGEDHTRHADVGKIKCAQSEPVRGKPEVAFVVNNSMWGGDEGGL